MAQNTINVYKTYPNYKLLSQSRKYHLYQDLFLPISCDLTKCSKLIGYKNKLIKLGLQKHMLSARVINLFLGHLNANFMTKLPPRQRNL